MNNQAQLQIPEIGKVLVQNITNRVYPYNEHLAGRLDMKLYVDGEQRINRKSGYNSSHPQHRPEDDDINQVAPEDTATAGRIKSLEATVKLLLEAQTPNSKVSNVPTPPVALLTE